MKIKMPAPDEFGDLREDKSWERKKIFEWTFRAAAKFIDPAINHLGPPVASVCLVNKHDEIMFMAESKWFGISERRGAPEGITAPTLAALRAKVEAAFRDQIIAYNSVTWDEWIEIKISSPEVEKEHGEKMLGGKSTEPREGTAYIHIEFETIKRARFPDGRDMVLERHSLYPFPQAKAAGTDANPRYSHNVYHQDDSKQYAYIPATPENLEAMQVLMGKIDEVNNRLLAILDQQSIKRTVSLLGTGVLRLEKK